MLGKLELNVYLSGEIHSNWRKEIVAGIDQLKLPITVFGPVTDHEMSDEVGARLLGREDSTFWNDHNSANINAIRIRTLIKKCDVVIVKFGDKFRQWNAAFDAGYAIAQGKSLITIHPKDPKISHALKEIDSCSLAVCHAVDQALKILHYVNP